MRILHAVLLIALCFVVYSNTYDHAYHLDSSHVLVDNVKVRSLKHVPEYFVDPGTFTSLRANVDYRPVLQVTYALNYWMGGYTMWWWHFTQVVLHALCVLGLYALCLRVLRLAEVEPKGLWIAFAAAVVFALHPTESGVVNYLSARSSLLTAAFLFPALLLYMKLPDESGRTKVSWGATVFFALAIFSKVEAVGCLAAFFLYEAWASAKRRGGPANFFVDLLRAINPTTVRRMLPVLVVAVAYFAIRLKLMSAFEYGDASRRADVTNFEYLMTQVVAWWYYVGHWVAPVNLVADHGNFPVTRSLLDGTFLLASSGWLLVATLCISQWKPRPYLAFLAVSALALLSPTSSIVPLSEMVNEHRPYMPLAVLSLSWMIPIGLAARKGLAARPVAAAFIGLCFVGICAALGRSTYQRNGDFTTLVRYWEDVVEKAPSGRALCNYGRTFMDDGDYQSALKYMLRSVEMTPYWHIPHTNLGIIYAQLGQGNKALEHYNRAVDYDKYSGTSLTWRGLYWLSQRSYAKAREDFEQSLNKSLEFYRNYKGLATAYAGLGDASKCFEFTSECLDIDPNQTGIDIVPISTPFFQDAKLHQAGIDFFQLLNTRIPDTWWVHQNLATLANMLGQTELATRSQERATQLKAAAEAL